jgi:uncharacterized protein YlbG (UPF0298 family)
MDLSELENKYIGKLGQIVYNNKSIFRVLIYANYKKITSIMKITKNFRFSVIEEELKENIIFMYLASGISQYK